VGEVAEPSAWDQGISFPKDGHWAPRERGWRPESESVFEEAEFATVMAVGKVREYGYRRIGLTVNEEFHQRPGGNLLSGFFYAQALLDLKPPIPPLLTFLKSRTTEELSRQKAALWQWLQRHKPDAVLTSDMADVDQHFHNVAKVPLPLFGAERVIKLFVDLTVLIHFAAKAP
jgi:hypothetical protein